MSWFKNLSPGERLFSDLDTDFSRPGRQKLGINQYKWLAPIMRLCGKALSIPVEKDGVTKMITVNKKSAEKFFGRKKAEELLGQGVSVPVVQQLKAVAKELFSQQEAELRKALLGKDRSWGFFDQFVKELGRKVTDVDGGDITKYKILKRYKDEMAGINMEVERLGIISIGNIMKKVVEAAVADRNTSLLKIIQDVVAKSDPQTGKSQ